MPEGDDQSWRQNQGRRRSDQHDAPETHEEFEKFEERERRRFDRMETRILNVLGTMQIAIKSVHTHTHTIKESQEALMANVADLNAAITQLATDLGEAVTRIEAKLAAGSTDLQPEVDALKAFSTTLDALAADPVVDPTL